MKIVVGINNFHKDELVILSTVLGRLEHSLPLFNMGGMLHEKKYCDYIYPAVTFWSMFR